MIPSNSYLILIFCLFWLTTQIDLFKRNLFYGFVYFMFFIYTIFSQIGYTQYPELSITINAYFGPAIFHEYWAFVILSMFSFYVVIVFFHDKFFPISLLVQTQARPKLVIFEGIIALIIMYLVVYFILNINIINYSNASDEQFIKTQGLFYIIFGIFYKLLTVILIIFHVICRTNPNNFKRTRRIKFIFLYGLNCLIFLSISFKIGSRTDPLAFLMGILVFELYKSDRPIRAFLKLLPIVALFLILMLTIEMTRTKTQNQLPIIQILLLKDYYAPSHMLFAAIKYNFIQPVEVLESNFCNSIFLMNHPYLQQTVTDLFTFGATRSSGYAFYSFTEGFLVMGFFGFLYNAVICFLGFQLWRSLSTTNHSLYNLFGIALISTMITNAVRGQSSYYIKYYLIFFIPGIFLFYLATGLIPKIRRRRNS